MTSYNTHIKTRRNKRQCSHIEAMRWRMHGGPSPFTQAYGHKSYDQTNEARNRLVREEEAKIARQPEAIDAALRVPCNSSIDPLGASNCAQPSRDCKWWSTDHYITARWEQTLLTVWSHNHGTLVLTNQAWIKDNPTWDFQVQDISWRFREMSYGV